MSEHSLDLLSQIRDFCNSLKHHAELHLEQSLACRVFQPTIVPTLTLELPTITNITDSLILAGAPMSTATELADIHIARANELRDKYSAAHTELCSELLGGGLLETPRQRSTLSTQIGNLVRKYENTISDWEDDLIRAVRDRFEMHKLASKSTDLKKRVFNFVSSHFVPYLYVFRWLIYSLRAMYPSLRLFSL